MAQLLICRGITDPTKARSFLDPKLSDLHKRSEALAEAAFLPPPDSDPQQVIQHQAKVRMLAGAAIPLMAKLRAAQEEIAQLKATVSE